MLFLTFNFHLFLNCMPASNSRATVIKECVILHGLMFETSTLAMAAWVRVPSGGADGLTGVVVVFR